MERISLPRRTVAVRPVFIVLIVAVFVASVLAVAGYASYLDFVRWYDMAGFRQVVLTGSPIVEATEDRVTRVWTLFEEGTERQSLGTWAGAAVQGDPFSADMRYVFARGLWREHNRLEALKGEGKQQSERRANDARVFVERAMNLDPCNCFYAMTMVGILNSRRGTGADVDDAPRHQVAQLLMLYPPQDTFGQILVAEYMLDLGMDKTRIRKHYSRALQLISTEVTSGLVDATRAEPGVATLPALGNLYVSRIVDRLNASFGKYEDWADVVPDRPEAHWLVAGYLDSKGLADEAARERRKLVDSVVARLAKEQTVSAARRVFEIVWPFAKSSYADPDRMLMNREIFDAAIALDRMKQPDESAKMFETLLARDPRFWAARMAYAELCVNRGLDFRRQSETADAVLAGELRRRADESFRKADDQLSSVLDWNPRSQEALDLRGRIPKQVE
jgi:tetratricopeptide (TPR) repeat protein